MNPLHQIIGTEEAAERWGLSQDHVKRLCRNGKIDSIRIGKTWIINKTQQSPKSSVQSKEEK